MIDVKIDYKLEFIKLCLRIESLNLTKETSFNYDEMQRCKEEVKEIYIKIDNILDAYSKNKNIKDLIKEKVVSPWYQR